MLCNSFYKVNVTLITNQIKPLQVEKKNLMSNTSYKCCHEIPKMSKRKLKYPNIKMTSTEL